MGVKGLWQLLDSEGVLDSCAVEFPSLKGKILAVDVSIWLYHFVKSVPSDKDSALSPLVIGGLFQRVCKLLHFGIKPIFVFDGSAPTLKKETIVARQELKRKGDVDYTKLAKKILKNKLKLLAIAEISTSNDGIQDNSPFERKKRQDKIEKAPPIDFLTFLESPEGSEEEDEDDYNFNLVEDDYDIDTSSIEFKKLPYDMQEQILLVSRKRTIDSTQLSSETSSIAHSLESSPKKGDSALDFSKAQVEALIKRRKLMDELETLRGNSVKKLNDSKVISHGKVASSDKKYIFTKNIQAGWTLSLTDSKNEKNKNEDISSFAEPFKEKESISDVDDDEFMNMMFGDSNKPERETPVVNNISEVKERRSLPIHISSSSTDLSESEFEIDIPQKTVLIANATTEVQTVYEDKEEFTIEQNYKLITEETVKLPEIVFEGLIKTEIRDKMTRKASDNEPIIVDDILSSSSENEIDPEYQDFIEEVSKKVPSSNQQTDFKDLVDKLQNELKEFNSLSEASALTSISPTKVLIDAFMEMLHLFRLPFIIAPFEAEAQCAGIGGIDGVISDDSDCLLFGTKAVYKGFFGGGGKKKQSGVSMITMSEITEKTGLKRNDLIVLAHLLGCDYCTGIEGIGPKRALELVRQVTSDDPLDALHKIIDLSQDTEKKYQKWLKDKIPNNFTDNRVIQAFLNPIVTPLKAEDMKWGSFDQANLERFMLINAKWTKDKTVRYLKDIEKKNK